MKILIDTNIVTIEKLIDDLRSFGAEIFVARATKDREVKGSKFEPYVKEIGVADETFVFGESSFPIRFGDHKRLKKIINIISSGSFPLRINEDSPRITDSERNQLRDALIYESSILKGCDYFCSNDGKAFINHGKRESLEKEFGVKIRRSDELLSEFCS